MSSKDSRKMAKLFDKTEVWLRKDLLNTFHSIGGMKVLLPLFLQLTDKVIS